LYCSYTGVANCVTVLVAGHCCLKLYLLQFNTSKLDCLQDQLQVAMLVLAAHVMPEIYAV